MKVLKIIYLVWALFGILVSLFSLAAYEATYFTPIWYFICWNSLALIPYIINLLCKKICKLRVTFILMALLCCALYVLVALLSQDLFVLVILSMLWHIAFTAVIEIEHFS